jgi:DNA-binding CsgD family transcriptional regulator
MPPWQRRFNGVCFIDPVIQMDLEARHIDMAMLAKHGLLTKEIGQRFHISSARVQQILEGVYRYLASNGYLDLHPWVEPHAGRHPGMYSPTQIEHASFRLHHLQLDER